MIGTVARQGILRCALYARRSTDEHQAASLDVQVEEAKRFIQSKGWLLEPEHVYLEDAVSRAEFKKRPAMLAMLNAASAKQVDVVVTRDETRIGGDMIRTGLVVQDLLDSGTALYFYFTGEEVRLEDATQKFIMAAKNFASELEREKISQRTREHLQNKARRGLNVGGKVYGYDNVEVKEGNVRVRVEYRINAQQALIVVEIFRRYAAGEGFKAVCKALNGRRVPSPWAGRRGTGSWSPGMVREFLTRERYTGKLVWGRMRKTYKGGTKVRVPQADAAQVTIVDVPQLRIIDDELWIAVQARRAERSRQPNTGGALRGRPPKYLLTNLLRCAECGGPIQAANGKLGTERVAVYLCGYHRTRGVEVCGNSLRRPVDVVDAVVVNWVRRHILQEEIILDVIAGARERLKRQVKGTEGELPSLEAEQRRLQREVARLVDVLAVSSENADPIIKGIADRNERLKELDGRIRAARLAPEQFDANFTQLEAAVRDRLANLTELLGRNVEEGRKLLQRVFPTPIRVAPLRTAYGALFEMSGEARVTTALFATGAEFTKCASPAGVEPALAT